MNRCICCINITWNQFPLFCQPHTVHSPGSLYPLHINSQSPCTFALAIYHSLGPSLQT